MEESLTLRVGEHMNPVILLFSLLRLDLNVYTAVYLLSEFHDPWDLETS